jgi:hypothetical protein
MFVNPDEPFTVPSAAQSRYRILPFQNWHLFFHLLFSLLATFNAILGGLI